VTDKKKNEKEKSIFPKSQIFAQLNPQKESSKCNLVLTAFTMAFPLSVKYPLSDSLQKPKHIEIQE